MILFVAAYLFYIVLYLIFSAAAIYHLWRFGYVGDLTKPVIIIYVVLSAAILVVSLLAILTTNFAQELNF